MRGLAWLVAIFSLAVLASLIAHYAQGYVLARPAFPMPEINFPLARRGTGTTGARLRPPPKPGIKGLTLDTTAASPAAAKGNSKKPSKRPSRRPTPPALPAQAKRPPPLPGAR